MVKDKRLLIPLIAVALIALVPATVLIVRLAFPKRPNVVLIIIDTLRADKLGCYGCPQGPSPELDELASQGVRFEQVVAQCTWTRPSIGSILTSLYPRSIGLYEQDNQILNDRFDTLAEVLQKHGYYTVGMTANPHLNRVFNFDQGFDHYLDSNIIFDFMNPERDKGLWAQTRAKSARELFHSVLQLLNSRRPALPCYVQLNIMEMHEAFLPNHSLTREEYRGLFPGAADRRYLQALRQVSADVSDFVRALSARPGWEDTLFVLTSDHGESLQEHPHVFRTGSHGDLLYATQVMVPLIFYHPQWTSGGRSVERPVRLLDVMPTILDFVGIRPPDAIVGKSLVPLFDHEPGQVELPELFVVETEFRESRKCAVYSREWKYIENDDSYTGVNPRELQPVGIEEDGKLTDRIADHVEIADSMREFLLAWRERYPRAESTPYEEQISAEELSQLKSLGYMQ